MEQRYYQVVAEFSGCADVSGGYSVSMTDAYDGWNGNILTVGDVTLC